MAWKNINASHASQLVTLSSKQAALETIIINTRGTGILKIYDCNDTEPTIEELFAEIALDQTDSLIQYLGSGVELREGITIVLPENPGNITFCWKEVS